MSRIPPDLAQAHVDIAERLMGDFDWTYFDQAYRQHVADQDRVANGDLLDVVNGIFVDELTSHCIQLRAGKETARG